MFQPLDATCFKAFKNAIKKVKDNVMAKNKYLELNKVTLIEWVDKWVVYVLQQSLKKDNIKSKYMICKIWPLNLIAIIRKFGSIKVFIAT